MMLLYEIDGKTMSATNAVGHLMWQLAAAHARIAELEAQVSAMSGVPVGGLKDQLDRVPVDERGSAWRICYAWLEDNKVQP